MHDSLTVVSRANEPLRVMANSNRMVKLLTGLHSIQNASHDSSLGNNAK